MSQRKIPEHNLHSEPRWDGPPVAVFWSQSLVWGLICHETLQKLAVPFHLLSGSQIARGALDRYRVLVVPGGWAAHKIRALGKSGRKQINQFIDVGGSYLGFCGGAGMALSSPPSLELVPHERMPLSERLPNASGKLLMRGIPSHPAWRNLPEEITVSIWWPAQFAWHPLPGSLPLGYYTSPAEDFWIADLPYSDFACHQGEWEEWESIYGINLDPKRLLGQPAILEIGKEKGRLILSYPHLETPGDSTANRMLLNLLHYLDCRASKHLKGNPGANLPIFGHGEPAGVQTLQHLTNALQIINDLISFGERHLLWYWNLPWLLRWQRGIRGLEYGMLAVSIRFLHEHFSQTAEAHHEHDRWLAQAKKLEQDLQEFCQHAKILLLEEKLAGHTGSLRKLGAVNDRVDRLRSFLFGSRMNHAGLCRTILDDLDDLLFQVLR